MTIDRSPRYLAASRSATLARVKYLRVVALVALAATACSCAQSILIRHSDPTYRRALERYRRTRELVATALAPEDEQDTFAMAEALYRYRFAAPHRTALSYLAEIGASVIDVPTLESLAGALDLFTLRLKANDGAVQLWESLLANDPSSPLAPFVLYRLGWAYRKAVVSGLPRTSDTAFDEVVTHYPSSPLASLAAKAKHVPWKSPGTATAWSLIPGAGQMYVCEYSSGAIRLAIALAAAAAVIAPTVIAYERRDDLTWHHDWPLLASGIVGGTVLAIDYTLAYEDALRGVVELNDRTEAAFEDANNDAP
jgi:hypothetical protein